MHVKTWNVPVAIGIGGTLDFIAGVQRRAPVWTRKIHCEWLWRWGTDPKRLTKRYVSNIAFLFRAVWLTLQLRSGRNIPAKIDSSAPPPDVPCHLFQGLETLPAGLSGKVIIDLRNVEMLCSNEIGALLELQKAGGKIVLLHAGSKVRKLFEFSKLTDRLPIVATCAEALDCLNI
jgi:N-acetylglucosaminyldiphosphoundecaprenol N-acetyl-beta-D-mannosaminyltransferase